MVHGEPPKVHMLANDMSAAGNRRSLRFYCSLRRQSMLQTCVWSCCLLPDTTAFCCQLVQEKHTGGTEADSRMAIVRMGNITGELLTYQLQILNAGQLPCKAAFARGDGREGSGDQVLLMPISKGRIHGTCRGRLPPALGSIPSWACLGRGWRVQEGRPSAQLDRAPNAGLLQTASNLQLAVDMPCTWHHLLEPQAHCPVMTRGSGDVHAAQDISKLEGQPSACCPHALHGNCGWACG